MSKKSEIKNSSIKKTLISSANDGLAAKLEDTVKELSDIKHALDESAIVAFTDQTGRITYVNDKFCEISKYSREELLGQDHRIINSGFHPKEFIRSIWTTIASGKIWRGELRNRAKDNSIYWVDTTIVPYLDERGKPYQYAAIRYDITSRKKLEENLQMNLEELRTAEEELRAQNEELISTSRTAEIERSRYLELFQFAPDGYLITDVRGVVRESNLAAQELFACRKNYLHGRPLVGFVDSQSRKTFNELLLQFNSGEGARAS